MLALTSEITTPLHRLPAGVKLAALALATPVLFALQSPLALALATLAVAMVHAWGAPRLWRRALGLLRPLGWFVAVILLWHLWLGDIAGGVVIALRMLAAVSLANLVTLTTRLEDMTDVLARLSSPLRRLGLNPMVPGLAVALVVRFTPMLLERARMLRISWRARSARRPGWAIVLPLALSALDDAEHVAEALRARGGVPDSLPEPM